ncbi:MULTISPECIES: hypothetical protein [unclassified Microcoleus]
MVEAGDTHSKLSCDVFNAKWLIKVFTKAIDCSSNLVSAATQNCNMT